MVMLVKALGYITYPTFSWKIALDWMPITLFFVIMLESSILALATISVPVFTVVKNFATIFIALGELYFFQKHISGYVYVTFIVMSVGSLFAVYDNVFVTPQGIFW
jgi:GDP-mannose transporter